MCLFITLEGGEGCGKTTLSNKLYNQLTNLGYDVIKTREPGGIGVAEDIRDIILDKKNTNIDSVSETLLFAAARRIHLNEVIIKGLNEKKIIICDRFIDSSLVYQGYVGNLNIEEVLNINKFAIGDYMPDITLYLKCDYKKGLERINDNNREKNRIDLKPLDFHMKVEKAYNGLSVEYSDRIKVIDANKSQNEVYEAALKIIKDFL